MADGNDAYLTGAYYYPWYTHSVSSHDGYLRGHLVPPQLPALGDYSDRDPAVIRQHLVWSKEAGIDFWAMSWWNAGSDTDVTTKDHILPLLGPDDVKIALHYETVGFTQNFLNYSHLDDGIVYMADHYFAHPNYLKIDGKPVIFVYLTRVVAARGHLQEMVSAMRKGASSRGFDLFIIGDHAFGNPPEHGTAGIELLDAITNYDVYGGTESHGYAGTEAIERYFAAQAGWQALAEKNGVGFVPAVSPGFNDKAVRNGHAPLSRQLTSDAEFGSLFRRMLTAAKTQTDPRMGNMLMITSWNEWHEDTQIEPVGVAPATAVDDTPTSSSFTAGLLYEGYGEKYLQILRDELSREKVTSDQ